MKKRLIIYTAALLSAASCIYPYTPDIDAETDSALVVDGEILVGGTSTIRLSYLSSIATSGASLVSPLGRAWVEDEDGTIYPSSETYLSESMQIPMQDAVPGLRYRAVIEADGNTYASEWLEASPAPVIEDISFDADEWAVGVYLDLDAGSAQTGYAGFEFEETWLFHSEWAPLYIIDPRTWAIEPLMDTWPYYWCFRSSRSSQRNILDYSGLNGNKIQHYPIHSFSRTDGRNHQRYSILVKAYSLSKDAYMYNKQTQEISAVGGDLFTPEPGTLKTNLHCENDPDRHVMGLVLAAEVASRRAYMDGRYLIGSEPSTVSFVIPGAEEYEFYYYDMNYRPIMDYQTEEQSGIGWGPSRCINCIDAGGTQERPSFWED